MSEITVSRPEVVNENTDVICSTSVRSRSLEYDNFPEISEANILSTFEQLHQNKDEGKRRLSTVWQILKFLRE